MSEKLININSENIKEFESPRNLIISKFGGTSVGSPEAIERVVEIVKGQKVENDVIVVVSAKNGITNQLLDASREKESGNLNDATLIIESVKDRHYSNLNLLNIDHDNYNSTKIVLDQYSSLLDNEIIFGGNNLLDKDRLLSIGEKMSASLVSAALNPHITSIPVDATEIFISDREFSKANIDYIASKERTKTLLDHINKGVVPVVTGFIASTMNGETTTLGRGGSDYSAAALARILNASELHIYTDVDGVYNEDPNINPNASLYNELDFKTAQEIANNGAKVIFSKMFHPLIGMGIPVWVRSSHSPNNRGTFIQPSKEYAA